MAENKKGFVLYADLIHTVDKLSTEEAGDLFKHILKYVNDEDPKTDNKLTEIAFEPIKQQLKRDLKKYEEKKIQWSEAGKRSAEARKAKKSQRPLTTVESRSTDSTVTVKDTVTVKVKDKDKDIKNREMWDFFWKLYPNKKAKINAKKSWDKLKMDEELYRKIIGSLRVQMEDAQWQKDDGRFIPHPATWLNAERWNDEEVTVALPELNF